MLALNKFRPIIILLVIPFLFSSFSINEGYLVLVKGLKGQGKYTLSEGSYWNNNTISSGHYSSKNDQVTFQIPTKNGHWFLEHLNGTKQEIICARPGRYLVQLEDFHTKVPTLVDQKEYDQFAFKYSPAIIEYYLKHLPLTAPEYFAHYQEHKACLGSTIPPFIEEQITLEANRLATLRLGNTFTGLPRLRASSNKYTVVYAGNPFNNLVEEHLSEIRSLPNIAHIVLMTNKKTAEAWASLADLYLYNCSYASIVEPENNLSLQAQQPLTILLDEKGVIIGRTINPLSLVHIIEPMKH